MSLLETSWAPIPKIVQALWTQPRPLMNLEKERRLIQIEEQQIKRTKIVKARVSFCSAESLNTREGKGQKRKIKEF